LYNKINHPCTWNINQYNTPNLSSARTWVVLCIWKDSIACTRHIHIKFDMIFVDLVCSANHQPASQNNRSWLRDLQSSMSVTWSEGRCMDPKSSQRDFYKLYSDFGMNLVSLAITGFFSYILNVLSSLG